jgi:hypothetical protein
MFIPDPNFFHPGSASKNLSILTQNIVSKHSEIWSVLFYPGSGSWSFTHPGSRIQRSKRHRIPDPDQQYWYIYHRHFLQISFPNLSCDCAFLIRKIILFSWDSFAYSLKILKSLMRIRNLFDPGFRIRGGKIRIRDKHPGSATLPIRITVCPSLYKVHT